MIFLTGLHILHRWGVKQLDVPFEDGNLASDTAVPRVERMLSLIPPSSRRLLEVRLILHLAPVLALRIMRYGATVTPGSRPDYRS